MFRRIPIIFLTGSHSRVSEGIGVRALLVHAKDDKARAFYLHYDFEPLPGYPQHLVSCGLRSDEKVTSVDRDVMNERELRS